MKKLRLLLIVLSSISTLFAQENPLKADSVKNLKHSVNEEFIERYKENRELSYTSPLGEIGAPSKFVIEGRLTTTYLVLATPKLPVAFAIIPDFTVKVRNERSAGVRTPSFRLGGAAYVRLNQTHEHYKYAELSFTHHSNGQDGDAIDALGNINTYNGNFSTNYMTASYRFGNFTAHNASSYYSFNHRAGLEWHKGFNYEPALKDDYGFTRLLYNFSFRRYDKDPDYEKESFRMNADFSYAVNKIQQYQFAAIKKRLNAELSLHYSFPFMQNVFLMAAAGYYGEDPYNIYYRDKYAYTRFGLSSGFIRNRRK